MPKKKSLWYLSVAAPLERKNDNRRVGGVKTRALRAATPTEVVALAVAVHRVAVVLGEETPGGAALVRWAPAASPKLTTRLAEEVKGQRWVNRNLQRLSNAKENLQQNLWLSTHPSTPPKKKKKMPYLGSASIWIAVHSLPQGDVGTLGGENCNNRKHVEWWEPSWSPVIINIRQHGKKI